MDFVTDDEMLFRSVKADRRRYAIQPDGSVRFTGEAFMDPRRKPSIDRAKLCNNNPSHAKKSESDGVTGFIAANVRKISDVGKSDKKGSPMLPSYRVEVSPDPIKDNPELPDNLAHAIIYTDPECQTDGEFTKLRRSLARLASQTGWLDKPQDLQS